MAGIYAAVARQLYTIDHTFGNSPPNWPELYLISQTDDGVGDPNAEKSEPALISPEIQAKINDQLGDLPAKIIWVNSRDEAPINPDNGTVDNGNGAIITLGNVHSQPDGTLQISASLYFASLGATGKTYILEKQNGEWVITGSTGAEWIS